jgi:hypothetical protein
LTFCSILTIWSTLIDHLAAVFMAVDMLGRLNAVMGERKVVRGKKVQ